MIKPYLDQFLAFFDQAYEKGWLWGVLAALFALLFFIWKSPGLLEPINDTLLNFTQ